MDDDIIDLARQLLLHAGMAMEDVSHIAIISPIDPEALVEAIAETKSAVSLAAKLISAAEQLIGYQQLFSETAQPN